MLAFIENPNLLIKEFNDLIDLSQTKAFITVGIEIQKEEIKTLNQYRLDLLELKKGFVSRGLENEANLVFCIEGSVAIIQYELEMLVNIKEDKMATAWANLVNAQTLIGPISRNYPFDENYLSGYMERLIDYEKLLFPKMFFQSTGGIIKKSECSICHQDLNTCEHLKGKLYMGEMCCRLISEIDLEEVSFVDRPANKHCRVVTIQSGDKKWDVLTLREVKDNPMDGQPEVKS
jgi:hypothetical protein